MDKTGATLTVVMSNHRLISVHMRETVVIWNHRVN